MKPASAGTGSISKINQHGVTTKKTVGIVNNRGALVSKAE